MHVQVVLITWHIVMRPFLFFFLTEGGVMTRLTHGSFKRRVDGPLEVTSQSEQGFQLMHKVEVRNTYLR